MRMLELVEKQRFVNKAQQIKEVLKDCVLTLLQKESRNLLRIAEDMSGNSSNDDKQCIPDRLKEEIHQVNLAMKLVSSPLHHTQDTGGPLSKEEEQMRRVEDHLTAVAMHKIPRGLKLVESFGPSFDHFVRALVSNITMQMFMPWHKYLELYHDVHLDYLNAYFPTENDLLVDLMFMFQLREIS
ncbi:hypothetical protein OROMI_011120 [Orobanche minor]